jgi:hypothetical protein
MHPPDKLLYSGRNLLFIKLGNVQMNKRTILNPDYRNLFLACWIVFSHI